MSGFKLPASYGFTKGESALLRTRKKHDVFLSILLVASAVIVLDFFVVQPSLNPAQASAPIILDDVEYCRRWEQGTIELAKPEQEGAVMGYCKGLMNNL